MEVLFFLIISLAAILISCIVFTNSIEWFGAKLNLSHGITGSILAAVGTALPETVVPLVAIFWGVNLETLLEILKGEVNSVGVANQISIGAIVGAPFMLCTIAFFLIGLSSFLYFKSGRRPSNLINVDESFFKRDLQFFLFSFLLAFLALFLDRIFHVVIAILLVFFYFLYLYKTFKYEKDVETNIADLEESLEPFLLSRAFPVIETTFFWISFQLVLSLLCLIYSAHFFVEIIKEVSDHFNVSPFLISLLITPLATELPEKFNSWIWIRQKKDILAVGNISGALVFQSTVPITVGLLFTSWKMQSIVMYLVFVICFVNSLYLLFMLKRNRLTYKAFLVCALLYMVYLFVVLAFT